MLVDVKYDTKTQEIHEWYKDERGKLHYRRFVPELGFYVEDPNGTNITAWGDPVREVRCRGLKELRKQIAMCNGKRTYETDVSPELQFISQKYYNAAPPPLNIAYFDIETDFEPYKYHITHKVRIMHRETKEEQVITVKDLLSLPMVHRYLVFDAVEKKWVHAKKSRYTEPGRGFAPPEDPFMPITAITVVLDWEDIVITVAMPPKTVPLEDAKQLCRNKWGDNVILFENNQEGEAEMLKTFLMAVQDADVLSGWNCVSKQEYVFTENKIQKLKDVKKGTSLGNNDCVVNVFDSGHKKKNVLTTAFGSTIDISDEHVVPIFTKDRNSYKNINTLKKNGKELNIAQIKEMIKEKDVFVTQKIHKNTNESMTYEKLDRLIAPVKATSTASDDLVVFDEIGHFKAVSSVKDDVISDDALKLLGMMFVDETTEIIHSENINKLSRLIYTDGAKSIDVEVMSQLSEDQFCAFISGCIDGASSVSARDIEISNIDGQARKIDHLLKWNGFITTVNDNTVRIKCVDFCSDLLKKIDLSNSDKKAALEKMSFFEKRNTPSNKIDWMLDYDTREVIVKIDSIEETDEMIEMGDIETKSHFFLCNGIKVHNSEGFDIPYTVNRVLKLLGPSYAKEFCRGGFSPKARTFEKYGKESQTYDLYGRVHIDYLSLYRNNTFEERASYSLDSIGEYELGERKVEYEGTLDQLYNYDFETFVDYSIQDVVLLSKLDKKLKFMDLINGLARKTGVRLPDAMGAVKKSDQAILNEAKYIRGLVMRDKIRSRESVPAAGAFVATPVKGLHKWIGSMDLNSLYPSIIRAMNMSPETIVGQIRQNRTEEMIAEGMRLKKKTFAECWEGRFACIEYELVMARRKDELLTIDWEDGRVDHLSADDVYKLVFETDNPLTLSANGTLFTTEREGIIPGVLTRWYAERVEMKNKAKQAFKEGDTVAGEHWDRQQLLTKLLLNSVYGILLNAGSRFFDPRLGQSITLTGRSIVKHMSAEVNKVITGDYDHAGLAVVYGDSVAGDTLIDVDGLSITVEDLFDSSNDVYLDASGKEYARFEDLSVMGFDQSSATAVAGTVSYVMRHRTNKESWTVEAESGRTVTVTGDHSIIVCRDGRFVEAKPCELHKDDMLVVKHDSDDSEECLVTKESIKSLVRNKNFNNEYVYDVSIKDQDPFFFGNGILVHNTDSVAEDSFVRTSQGNKTVKELFESGDVFWTEGDKQYSRNDNIAIAHTSNANEVDFVPYNYVYRHKTNKDRYKITTESGKHVIVTEDHSVIVKTSNGEFVEKKPADINNGDVVITICE